VFGSNQVGKEEGFTGVSPLMKRDSLDRKVALLLLIILLIRAGWHAFSPVGVAGDEAYYWDWSRRLSWGYFSKPPGIAWIHALAGWLSGQSAFGMKLVASALSIVSVWFFYRAIRAIAGDQAAAIAALAGVLIPGNLLLGSFLTTDSPLFFFWNLGFWMSCRIISERRAPVNAFVVLGLAIGAGALCKQMMLVQIPLVFIGVLWLRRDVLLRWELPVATLGSLLFLIPTLVWNISNDWITVEHTAHHFQTARLGVMITLERIGFFYVVLAFLLSPAIFMMILLSVWKVSVRLMQQSLAVKWLWLWGVVPFLVISLMTLRQAVNPNWPAVFLAMLIGLVAVFYQGRHGLWKVALGTGAVFSLFLLALPFGMDHLYRMGILEVQKRGWTGYEELAEEVDKIRKSGENVIVIGHRHTTSHLAFHMQGQPKVWHWHQKKEIHSQYDLWPGPEMDKACILVVESMKDGKPRAIVAHVSPSAEFIKGVPLHKTQPKTVFHIYRANGLKSWPTRAGASL